MNLFQYGQFKGASGKLLDWKMECDCLTQDDIECIVKVAVPYLQPFRRVIGVPTGGNRIAKAFEPYKGTDGSVLIVDDVWTTGKSMTAIGITTAHTWKGFVIFARGPHPPWIKSFWKLALEDNHHVS